MGLKLIPVLHLDSKRVEPEQLATHHPMDLVHNVSLEHPAHPVPPHAKPATKESLTTKTVKLAATVWQKRFKIKVPVHRALLVLEDGNNPTQVPLPASV